MRFKFLGLLTRHGSEDSIIFGDVSNLYQSIIFQLEPATRFAFAQVRCLFERRSMAAGIDLL